MKLEHFKLNNKNEVKLFCERLDKFQENKVGYSLPYIDLNIAFKNLQDYEQGARLFTALLDLKINFVMLNIDFTNAGGAWNNFFSKGKLEDGSVLDSQIKFNGKAEMQYYNGNFIPKYRAIWDKIMGIMILMFKPESYEKYRKAKSRKKEFQKLALEIQQIPNEFAENIIKGITDFDNNFRTPEVHGTGKIRKWSFTMYSLHETPLIELQKYWNWLLPILSETDRILKGIEKKE
ncbi:hypothetical protein [Tenacibaculum soleae]|mgnify:CR=1 FL=1|uniref:hypothetical protein n=1 Tax=Tenacibaculum soleae TaxID=447689 RepID=UPI0026E44EFF|nr:hypothetical protein [Tenacibaculum soleae]MDO6814015.1 hypothetical protein [Tenacibaculum soleae]